MAPFVFSDGTHIPAGNTVCVPQQAMMQDPKNYANPLEFQGFRFVTQRDGVVTSTSRLSHPSPQFPFWGSVGRAWCVLRMQFLPGHCWAAAYNFISPARSYVSMVVKMILVHAIKHYDIQLANEDSKSHLSWGVSVVPHPRLTFLIRKRSSESA